jgi:hypothetical protein
MDNGAFEYDVCLSFAGEDRDYVETVARGLRDRGIRVFYDRYATVELWGKELYEHLYYVYHKAARFCVLFVSDAYGRKVWPTHERRSAQERALGEDHEYILPARFDDTDIPGLRGTVGHIDLRDTTPEALVELIAEKLGPRTYENFFPPLPDNLFTALDAEAEEDQERVTAHAYRFFETMKRMSPEERLVVLSIFAEGCPAELPDNIHMSLDLIRRITGMPVTQVTEILSGLGSLGFVFEVREEDPDDEHDLAGTGPLAVISWNNLSTVDEAFEGEPLAVAETTLGLVLENYCEEHGRQTIIDRMDFSALASSTKTEHAHDQPETDAAVAQEA